MPEHRLRPARRVPNVHEVDISTCSHIPVLLYHSFGDRPRSGLKDFTLPCSAFDEHVAILVEYVRQGATPMLICDLAAALRGERPLPARPFAVTTDDGYDDNFAPLMTLAEVGIPSTIYVTAEFVGRPDILSPEQIRELAANPLVDVGAHAVHHVRLDALSRAEIERELRGGRAFLREVTGTAVESVAYPHGAHDMRVLSEVARAGYTSGVAVKNMLSRPGDDHLAIARWTVRARHTTDDLIRVMEGMIPTVRSGERLSTRGYRAVRRTRHRLGRLTRAPR